MAETEFGSAVVIVSKSSPEYLTEGCQPPCPSVEVNNIFIVKDGVISYEDLKTAILQAG